MQIDSNFKKSRTVSSVRLYSVVFLSRKISLVVILLFMSFLIQPVHQAFANEAEAEVNPTSLPAEVENQLPDVEEDISASKPEVVEKQTVDLEEDVVDEVETQVTQFEEGNSDVEEISENTEAVAQDDDLNTVEVDEQFNTQGETSSSSENVADDNQSQVETNNASTTEETVDGADPDHSSAGGSGGSSDSTDETETASSTDEIASSTDEVVTEIEDDVDSISNDDEENNTVEENVDNSPSDSDNNDNNTDSSPQEDDLIDDEAIENGVNNLVDEVVNEVVNLTRQLVTEENYYQFSRQSCAPVGDGTFHCTMKTDLPYDSDSAVYAERDEDGDMEIYLRTSKGDIKQLTDNDYDDSSPDVDLASMRVVWQRLIDGRYQIISYDLEEREETQLTFSRNNSMEPKVSKEGIVWQAWDGNDWEVLYFDGQFTDQITTNELQDVTPVIEDGYILWSVLGGKDAEARVYSLETGEILTISGHEGGAVTNPRFVLVYDTKFDNGDIVTQSFDPVTGLAKPIAAKPTELPFDIPEPDPIGEVRALIQNKSTDKDKQVVTVHAPDTDSDLNLASTSATSTDTLNLNGLDDAFDIATTTDVVDFELTEFDLVITNSATSSNSAMNKKFEVVDVPDQTASSTQL